MPDEKKVDRNRNRAHDVKDIVLINGKLPASLGEPPVDALRPELTTGLLSRAVDVENKALRWR